MIKTRLTVNKQPSSNSFSLHLGKFGGRFGDFEAVKGR